MSRMTLRVIYGVWHLCLCASTSIIVKLRGYAWRLIPSRNIAIRKIEGWANRCYLLLDESSFFWYSLDGCAVRIPVSRRTEIDFGQSLFLYEPYDSLSHLRSITFMGLLVSLFFVWPDFWPDFTAEISSLICFILLLTIKILRVKSDFWGMVKANFKLTTCW